MSIGVMVDRTEICVPVHGTCVNARADSEIEEGRLAGGQVLCVRWSGTSGHVENMRIEGEGVGGLVGAGDGSVNEKEARR